MDRRTDQPTDALGKNCKSLDDDEVKEEIFAGHPPLALLFLVLTIDCLCPCLPLPHLALTPLKIIEIVLISKIDKNGKIGKIGRIGKIG